jgi:hypothetical protein
LAKKSVTEPLTEEEVEDFHRLLNDDERFERMVDQAVRGMKRFFRGK